MMNISKIDQETHLDLPWFLTEEKSFKTLIKKYDVSAGIYEILPFRERGSF